MKLRAQDDYLFLARAFSVKTDAADADKTDAATYDAASLVLTAFPTVGTRGLYTGIYYAHTGLQLFCTPVRIVRLAERRARRWFA